MSESKTQFLSSAIAAMAQAGFLETESSMLKVTGNLNLFPHISSALVLPSHSEIIVIVLFDVHAPVSS